MTKSLIVRAGIVFVAHVRLSFTRQSDSCLHPPQDIQEQIAALQKKEDKMLEDGSVLPLSCVAVETSCRA